ncbi:MAG: TIGR03960 family B12-binding radical SAM protein, partial [Thermodesulfobacteriota bacterium]
ERGRGDPFVIGGGPVCFNPEPVAEFFDAFLLGDGEEAVLEIAETVKSGRERGEERAEILKSLAGLRGVYVPSLFDVRYNPDSTIKEVRPLLNGYAGVEKRVVSDINRVEPPVRPVVPFAATIHDRVTVEICRGCTRGCRFCQAGIIYRPARERSPENITGIVKEALKNTGYDDVSLLSLSAGDYTLIEPLLVSLMGLLVEERVAVSLPSLRVGTLSERLASEIMKVRKTGFTLAPEAGTDRLRRVVNKGIEEEDLLNSARDIFTLGWRSVKLYFMIGLPTETDEDIDGIVRLADCVRKIGRAVRKGKGAPQINVSVSTFVPKPFTPFQWETQKAKKECGELQQSLKRRLKGIGVEFKWHDPEMSELEGVFSRGDRRLSKAILRAFKKGARFDGWGECFDAGLWRECFAEAGIDRDFYTIRKRGRDEVMAWDHLFVGVKKDFLLRELETSIKLGETPDCKVASCTDCGVCDHRVVKNIVVSEDNSLRETARPGRAAIKGPSYKVVLRFSKTGAMRFLSHLELVNALKRTIRRAGLPVIYSGGFHPLPKLSFSDPLPVGVESLDESISITLEERAGRLSPPEISARLNNAAPVGIKFYAGEDESLQLPRDSVNMKATEYIVFLENGPEGLNLEPGRIDGFLRDFLSQESIPTRINKGDKSKTIDIKPLIVEFSRMGENLRIVLKKNAGLSVRPLDAVARLLNLPREEASLIPVRKTRTVYRNL